MIADVRTQKSRFVTCPHCRTALEVQGRRPKCPACRGRIDPETAQPAFASATNNGGNPVGINPQSIDLFRTDQFEHIDNIISGAHSSW